MNVRPIDGAALYEAFREELKRHPVPETPGLGRYRAVVWQEAASVMIALLMKAPTIDVKPATLCKDCAVPHNKWIGCPNLNGLIPPSGFGCTLGERKE